MRHGRSRTRAFLTVRADDGATTWLARIAVAVGLLNVTVLLAQAADTIHQLDTDADYAMSLVLPALAGRVPAGSVITLGNHAYYESWWFNRATIGLPEWRFIWEAAPFVVEAAGIALVSWCVWVVLGRVAAVLCSVALLSITDGLRVFLAQSGGRVGLTFHAGALCAALLIIGRATRAPRVSRRTLVAVALFTVFFGTLAASDQLVAVTVVVPYMIAPCMWWWYERTRAAREVCLYALATGAVSLIAGSLLTSRMQAEGVVHSAFPVLFASVGTLTSNAENLIYSWTVLGGGTFFGLSASGQNLLTFAAGVLCLLALAGVLSGLSRRAYALLADTERERVIRAERFLFISFWGVMLAITLAIFLMTQVSIPTGSGTNYLLSGWVAVATLLGAFAQSTRLRSGLLLGVAAFGILTFRTHLASGVPAYGTGPTQLEVGDIEHFARVHGATIGYAQYLDAPTITWDAALKTQVYPVWPCGYASGLCPFFIGINSWYTPRGRVPTFLVTDSRPAATAGSITAAPAALGKPIAVAPFPPFTVYVYRYDIAAKLGPPS